MTRPRILVAGIDSVMPKLCYAADELEKLGFSVSFFSYDKNGNSRQVCAQHNKLLAVAPRQVLPLLKTFRELLRRDKPDVVELYLGFHPVAIMLIVRELRKARIPYIVWCRGTELLRYETQHPIRRFSTRMAMRYAGLVVTKELHMAATIDRNNLTSRDKVFAWHNAVPILSPPQTEPSDRKGVLFLNSLKPWRRVELLVEAASRLSDALPECPPFWIVGSNLHDSSLTPAPRCYEEEIRSLVNARNVAAIVSIEPFTRQPGAWYEKACVFVLPADIVYCNNALLEAMERQVVPIVADAPGADKIVKHGHSGFIVHQDAQAIAAALEDLFSDPGRMDSMGRAARKQIVANFDIAKQMDSYVERLVAIARSSSGSVAR